MKHVFLDSSVLISFCASKTGASAEILKHCRDKKLQGHISKKVILEVRKNTALKLGEQAQSRFEYVLTQNFLTIESDPSQESIERCKTAINQKDAPIFAAALSNKKITEILTLDKKDFKKPEVIQFAAPVAIYTPGEFVKKLKTY